jgi:DNA-binding NtrC family response regulator
MEKNACILIVDDNVNLTRAMAFVLKRKGYTVITAKDGLEGVRKTKESSFTLILMDIKMPRLNGVEALKRILKIQPDSIVVMTTAYSVDDLIQEALQEGAYGVIHKPVNPEEIITLLETISENMQEGNILIVDDNPGTCKAFKNILRRKGYHVIISETGEEAISQVKSNKFDIIFLDMKLPTMNGLETYLNIKKIDPEATVIMVTAYRQEVDDLLQIALDNSAYASLYKPFDIPEVLKMIEEIPMR